MVLNQPRRDSLSISKMVYMSSLQKYILKWLLDRVRDTEQEDPALLGMGIKWRVLWNPERKDPSEDKAREHVWRVSVCRSLDRLEKRGLIRRIRGDKNARTT